MTVEKVRWGILGTAKIAQKAIIPAIQRSSNGIVSAIVSGSGKAKDIADQLGIPKHYDSYESLLEDPDIDAVYIPLPNNLHYEWTLKAAQAKKHILCEKPAALNAQQVQEMISACQENQVLFMEAFMYRFHPQHAKVKELIAAGAIGDLKMLRANFSFYMEERDGNIRLNPELGGGALYDVGCYCLNAFQYILGEKPETVTVQADQSQGVDATSYGSLQFPSGIKAQFSCSFDMAFHHVYEAIGTEGVIRVPYAFRPDTNGGVGIIQVEKGDQRTEYAVQGDQYRLEVEHFADCIQTQASPSYRTDQIVDSIQVIEAAYQSIAEKREIVIPADGGIK